MHTKKGLKFSLRSACIHILGRKPNEQDKKIINSLLTDEVVELKMLIRDLEELLAAYAYSKEYYQIRKREKYETSKH